MCLKSQLCDWHITVLYNLMIWGIIGSKSLDQMLLSPGPGWRHCQIPGYIQEQRSGQPITLPHPHKPLCEADNVLNIADPGGFSQTLPRMTCSSHMPGQQQLSLVVFMVSTVKHFLLLMTLHTYTLGATVQL